MAEQELDRSENASPYKLEQARRRGSVAKSADLVSAIAFAVAAAYLYWQGWPLVLQQLMFDQAVLGHVGRVQLTAAGTWHLLDRLVLHTFTLLAPLLLALMLAGIVANVMQTGPVFSFTPLQPDWTRLNPVTGIKRLFSLRTLFDAGKACIKLIVLATTIIFALSALLPQFFELAGLPPLAFLRTLHHDIGSVALKIALALGLIAMVDVLFTRREFAKRMRMSRRELRDEHKHREGDPRIRARLRELRREALKRSLTTRRTGEADVVVTNPTHLAVALQYRPSEMSAPVVIAKGAGVLALRMRAMATRHHIPVVVNRTLARALFRRTGIDAGVPEDLYSDIARIMVWVFMMREQRMQSGVASGLASHTATTRGAL